MFNFVSAPRTRLIAQFLAGGALAAVLSTAQAQNNFLGDGAVSSNAPKVSIRDLAPDTLTSWVPDRPTGDDLLPPLNGGPGPIMSPKDRPYVPNCPTQVVTVPGRNGTSQNINITQCF